MDSKFTNPACAGCQNFSEMDEMAILKTHSDFDLEYVAQRLEQRARTIRECLACRRKIGCGFTFERGQVN